MKKPLNEPKLTTRNTIVGLSFVAPNFIGFSIFVLAPVIYSLLLCFTRWNGSIATMKFVGLENFIRVFKDTQFGRAMLLTVVYAVFVVALTTFAALGLAVLLNRQIKAKGFFRTAIFFPYVASVVSIAVVWKLLFMAEPAGPINSLLKAIGIARPPEWFTSSRWALWGVIIVSVWRGMGYYMIVYLAALQDIPRELKEAASIDGATGLQYFWRIAFPHILPATFFVVLMLTMGSFKSFDLIYALTEGGPGNATSVISLYIYNNFMAFNSGSSIAVGKMSAAAMMLFLMVAAITFFQFRMEKKLSA
ncbi:MAG: sugar ABC transporter permease [Treponema sp.]|jgi:ABC-type sugar transport system permease subunit|nr:sugar ABC transporter permease [Treponema sp.]